MTTNGFVRWFQCASIRSRVGRGWSIVAAAPRERWLLTLLPILVLALGPGCGRYVVGQGTLYAPDIKTVYVPMFDSSSFRRGLGERLTEAVVKEIEERTPYKVVHTPDADSVLAGRIINESKGVMANAPTAEPRYLQEVIRVEVSWTDRKGGQLQNQIMPLPQSLSFISGTSTFAPEVGSSITTAQQQDMVRIARQIVSLMEAPW